MKVVGARASASHSGLVLGMFVFNVESPSGRRSSSPVAQNPVQRMSSGTNRRVGQGRGSRSWLEPQPRAFCFSPLKTGIDEIEPRPPRPDCGCHMYNTIYL